VNFGGWKIKYLVNGDIFSCDDKQSRKADYQFEFTIKGVTKCH